jgi:conjugal transfer pilus assembly protein TraA
MKKLFALFVVLFAAMLPEMALAGTGGTEFSSAYSLVTGWVQGELGRLLAISLLIVGVGMGIVKQSVMAAVPAIGAGLVVNVAPTIIGLLVTAVI